jgi:hypothetical protein
MQRRNKIKILTTINFLKEIKSLGLVISRVFPEGKYYSIETRKEI